MPSAIYVVGLALVGGFLVDTWSTTLRVVLCDYCWRVREGERREVEQFRYQLLTHLSGELPPQRVTLARLSVLEVGREAKGRVVEEAEVVTRLRPKRG